MNEASIKPISLKKSLFLFGLPSILFYVITKFLIPLAISSLKIEYVFAWFLFGGLCVFIPLFIWVFILIKYEQKNLNYSTIVKRLRLQKPNEKEIRIALISTIVCFALSGLIVVVYNLIADLTNLFEHLYSSSNFFNKGDTNPSLILVAWLPFFFFNIFGEELLWRGFILPGQIVYHGMNGWIVNSIFWLMFHLAFDYELILTLIPILFILPYVVQKYKNTWIGIIIHALYNGPIFILITLGVIS